MADVEHFSIDSMDGKGRGVARRGDRAVFIEDALPGEQVCAVVEHARPSHAVARLERMLRPSAQRVTPRCPHFGVCGGCVMQHLDAGAQVAVKQRLLEDAFQRIGGQAPAQMLTPLHGPYWGYRHRARLAVRCVPGKGVLLGFHKRKSSHVADIRNCQVLPAPVSALLGPLHGLVAGLSMPHRIPQIEVAVGDAAVVLVLRHLLPLTQDDLGLLRAFAASHGVSWWLQPAGPDSAAPLAPQDADILAYRLPRFGLRMPFRPTDFIQANPMANQALVTRALDLLQAQAGERVADLFCGLGNFTLPLATLACEVVGVEGSPALLDRACSAAAGHGLAGRVRFEACNLFEVDAAWLRAHGRFDRMLLDPPREGAQALCGALAQLAPSERPARIVYVSCDPRTLARDAAILAHRGGYRLRSAGVVNMFPHTGHVESLAVFE